MYQKTFSSLNRTLKLKKKHYLHKYKVEDYFSDVIKFITFQQKIEIKSEKATSVSLFES